MPKNAPGQRNLDGSVEGLTRAQRPLPSILDAVPPVRARVAAGAAYRLLGPPGCGKTTALASRWIPAAVKKYGVNAVVVCSLTKAAAHAIVEKGLSIPQTNVGTLHSFALRSIGRPPVAQDRKHLDDWNATCSSLYRLTPAASNMDGLAAETAGQESGDEWLAKVEINRHQLIPEDDWLDPVRRFYNAWRSWKEKNEYVDFTDMMELALGTEHCPGMPAVLIIDEAQDCSRLEMKLVRHWGEACEQYVLAGDADQSIYEFRGASADAFMSMDVDEANVYTLDQSYRVPVEIQKYARRWIQKIEHRHDVEYKPKKEIGECRIANNLSLSYTVPLVREVEKDVDAGHEVMILATCAYMLKSSITTLRKRGVAFHNPYRTKNGYWNPLRGGGNRLLNFLGPMRSALSENAISPRLWTWLEIHRWLDPLSVKNSGEFEHGCKTLVKSRTEADRLCQPVTKGELLDVFTRTGMGILKNALTNDEDAMDWYRHRLLATRRKQFDYAFTVVRKRGIKALIEEPKVIVGTIHSVKGGGTNVVYLAPDLPNQAALDYARGRRHEEVIEGDRVGEQARRLRYAIIRQFYVGMTRATDKLVLLRRGDSRAVKWLPIQEN